MSKYTIIADLHVTNDTLSKVEAVLKKVHELANPVIVLGDVFSNKQILSGKSLNFFFKTVHQSPLKWYILVGNHDMFTPEGIEHSLEIFKTLPNVMVIDKPTAIKFNSATCTFIPYHADEDTFIARINHIKKAAQTDILFLHQGINSFYFNTKIADTTSKVTPELFENIPLVIAGHYHEYQKKGNVIYIGSAYAQSWGEANQKKFIAELNMQSKELKMIDTQLPEYVSITVDAEKQPRLDKVQFDPKNFNRICISGSYEAVVKFDKSNIPDYVQIITNIVQKIKRQVCSEVFSIEENWIQYCAFKKLNNMVKQMGLAILKDCK